jgi:hypothetical protein
VTEELIFSMESGVYHVGSRVGHTPQHGGYLDAYEARCGESCEVWRRPRALRVGPLRMVSAHPWESNRYIPLLDRPPNNPHLCEWCTGAARTGAAA